MTNLSSFAELIKKANEDKKLREDARVKEVTPLLTELFASVAKAKEVQKEIDTQESPLLAELHSALRTPEKFIEEKQEKKKQIGSLVTELEAKVSALQEKLEIDKPVDDTDVEKKFLRLFNNLQNDFQTLKKYVESSKSSSSGYSSGGSGEVRILRMDDVTNTHPADGDVLAWDSTLNKFKPVAMASGGTTITDEEMPYAKRVDFVTDSELYKGEAIVGASETSSVWRIRKVVIGVDSDVTETWASGTALYDKKWSDRLTYTYL